VKSLQVRTSQPRQSLESFEGSRIPTTAPDRFYLPQLDGLRFMAFLLVFVHHAPRMSGLFRRGSMVGATIAFVETFGWCGVDLFLVLSAYLITSLLLIEHQRYRSISLREFYIRRILRIWPLYYLMIGVGFFILPALSIFAPPLGSPEYARLMKDHFVAYSVLFGNYSVGAHGYPSARTLAHMWTVTLEEQFYIVWPLTLSLMLRCRRTALWMVLAALLAGTLVLRMSLVGRAPHPYIWTNTLTRLDPLLFGIAIALWRRDHPPQAGWMGPIVKLTLGLAAIAAVSLGPPIETQSRNIAWQLLATAGGFALILDAALPLGRNPLSWFLSRKPMMWLGKLTYGLYVYHVLALQLGGRLVDWLEHNHIVKANALALPLRSIASFLLTVAVAAASYRFFESFFLRLKERVTRVKSRPIETTSS
jgi:peptidoglycan/LPS O-acetylase OafA/YrhL